MNFCVIKVNQFVVYFYFIKNINRKNRKEIKKKLVSIVDSHVKINMCVVNNSLIFIEQIITVK